MIHKKRRGVSRKPDDHGKAKKKARVVVEARFTTTRCLKFFKCFEFFSLLLTMSVLSLCQVEQEDENVRRILKTVS